TRRVKIAGLGKFLPSQVVTSAELEERMGLEAGWIAGHTGVEQRHYVKDETASYMGAHAARAALEDAGAALSDVGLLICAAGSTEQQIPCTAVLIQRELGKAADGIPCFDVNSTCLSFLHGLDVAAHAVANGAHRAVLVVSTEVSSVALNYRERESSVL